MGERIPEISSSSIVLVGSFNPTIFQPEWFARHGLLPQEQVDTAEIKFILPQVLNFETEQMVIHVMQDKFTVFSKPSVNAAPISDLVQGTFFILEHTPVTAMGLNRHMHFALESEEAWHKLGDRLAPKDGWKDAFKGRGRPGMLALSITAHNPDVPGSQYTVRVEPSMQVKFGVYFDTNENYPGTGPDSLKTLMKTLREKWEETDGYATSVVDHVLNWAGKDN